MTIQDDADVAALRRIGRIVGRARDAMLAAVRPGITTAELDAIGRAVLVADGARSAPELVYRFPAATCVSVNDEAAHGIPSANRALAAGDVVNVDVSAELDGYFADTGASCPVGRASDETATLLRATREALAAGIRATRAGFPLHAIGRAVEERAARAGFRVVRELGGHGVGRGLHEEPVVPSVFDPTASDVLPEGLVLTIEPFLTRGLPHVYQDRDGWTLRTLDGSACAQFEHTLVVTRGRPIVVTV